jgi:hypothetical protein
MIAKKGDKIEEWRRKFHRVILATVESRLGGDNWRQDPPANKR